MTQGLLEMKNVNTFYGRIPMLMDVSIKINQGEVVCVLGANGAGKTTLLKTILGMVKADSGSIIFDDKDMTNQPTHKIIEAGVAIAAAGVGTFPKMSVDDNLRMGAYYVKEKKFIEERLEEVYQSFPVLKERLQQKAGTLSGGERTMLSLARALLSSPKIIMMDEPSLGLAPIMVEEVFEIVQKLREEGKTILLVEQNAEKALGVSDYGYIIQKGQIIMGDEIEVLRNSEFVENPVM